MRISEPGIFTDVAPSVYYEDPCVEPSLTQSLAKVLIERSPAHAKLAHPRLTPSTPDDDAEKYVAAQAIGNAAHAALIGRGRRIIEAPFDDWRKAEARLLRDTATKNGDIPILPHHAKLAREMVKAASFQLEKAGCADAFRSGSGEVVVVAKERDIWLRTLIDWMVNPTRLFDYKSTAHSIAPHCLGRLAESAGWHVQAAFHERLLDHVDAANAGRRRFFFAVQENKKPHALVVVELDEHWLAMGRRKIEHAVSLWRHCMQTGIWFAYPSQIIVPEYPKWSEAEWLEREIANEQREPMLTDLSGG
jgi:hypothetical protein